MTHSLIEVARELPDIRDRLNYVGGMTEAAATRVLGLVDQATPCCSEMLDKAQALTERLQAVGADHPLAAELVAFVGYVREAAASQRETLTSIMMAQDFQDLSGQVINKVDALLDRTHGHLMEMLGDTAHAELDATIASTELAGPQTPDRAMKQDDVDDLLAAFDL